MSLLQNQPVLATGRTVTYRSAEAPKELVHAVIVEIRHGGMAELDNGEHVLLAALQLVLTGEQWLPVQEFADRYALSSHGKLISLSYSRTGRPRLLRPSGIQRYPSVSLYGPQGVRQVGLNRLVARHFLPPPVEARFTHLLPKDGNHLNLRFDNLQWVDPREREKVAVLERFHLCGARNTHSKLTADQVRQIRALAAAGRRWPQLATEFGVSRPTISQIVRRVTWRTI